MGAHTHTTPQNRGVHAGRFIKRKTIASIPAPWQERVCGRKKISITPHRFHPAAGTTWARACGKTLSLDDGVTNTGAGGWELPPAHFLLNEQENLLMPTLQKTQEAVKLKHTSEPADPHSLSPRS